MEETAKTKGSGRLNSRQIQIVGKIAGIGRNHPKYRKFFVTVLVTVLLWFYLISACKTHKTAVIGLILTVLCVSAAIHFLTDDSRQLAQQQKQLNEIRALTEEALEDEEEAPVSSLGSIIKENKDTAGWLTIPGTIIDYPVMQTPEDENYYLYRDFYRRKNKNGSLILSAGCDVSKESTNWIIHGHNMKSGAMFGGLSAYADPEYGQEHMLIFLETENERRVYQVISVFYSQVYYENDDVFKFYRSYDMEDEKEFREFYQNIKALSRYDTGVTAVHGDSFITLSTCAYHTENGRFVVVGKQIYR